ncbi:MAG: MotA/TolQ/ExbB proton channel family protein [Verrucomicrobiota bacterium]
MDPNTQGASSLIQLFNRGGIFMYLLAACSVVGVAVIILRLLGLRRDLAVPPKLRLEIERMQPDSANPLSQLAPQLMGDRSPLGRIVRVALKHMDVSRSENQDAVQAAARREVVMLEQGLFILEIMVGITPLLGLLGAVSGLVKVFGAFGDAAGQSDPHVIAAGISEALSTTVVGLAIAIPCLVAYSCFVRKLETIASELESLVSLLLTKCYQHKLLRGNDAPSS